MKGKLYEFTQFDSIDEIGFITKRRGSIGICSIKYTMRIGLAHFFLIISFSTFAQAPSINVEAIDLEKYGIEIELSGGANDTQLCAKLQYPASNPSFFADGSFDHVTYLHQREIQEEDDRLETVMVFALESSEEMQSYRERLLADQKPEREEMLITRFCVAREFLENSQILIFYDNNPSHYLLSEDIVLRISSMEGLIVE